MSDKSKVIIAIGGTGGHVFPGCSLANHLIQLIDAAVLLEETKIVFQLIYITTKKILVIVFTEEECIHLLKELPHHPL